MATQSGFVLYSPTIGKYFKATEDTYMNIRDVDAAFSIDDIDGALFYKMKRYALELVMQFQHRYPDMVFVILPAKKGIVVDGSIDSAETIESVYKDHIDKLQQTIDSVTVLTTEETDALTDSRWKKHQSDRRLLKNLKSYVKSIAA